MGIEPKEINGDERGEIEKECILGDFCTRREIHSFKSI